MQKEASRYYVIGDKIAEANEYIPLLPTSVILFLKNLFLKRRLYPAWQLFFKLNCYQFRMFAKYN